MIIKFSVDMTPRPQPRPRVNRNGIVYEPFAISAYKRAIAIAAKDAMHGLTIITPVLVGIDIRRNLNAASRNFGDIDNHIKSVLDAMNGIVYADDRLVVSVNAVKIQSRKEGVDITINTLGAEPCQTTALPKPRVNSRCSTNSSESTSRIVAKSPWRINSLNCAWRHSKPSSKHGARRR